MTQRKRAVGMPYWRLSAFYFFFFASLGALTPYWPLYLQSLGFGPTQIGQLMAVMLATKIVSPNLWAWLADRRACTLPVARAAALLAFACFLGMYRADTFWWVALTLFCFSFFWQAVLPQVETATFNHLGAADRRYGRIRLWGSCGFILLVLALGPMVERFGAGVTLPAVALALLFVCLTTILIPEPDRAEPETSEPRPRHVFGHRQTTVLLTCCLLMQASHAPYYAFFSIYLSDQGYAKDSIGALWAFGVVCEVAVFFFMHRLLRRFPAATLLAASFVVTALRWTLIALYPQSLPLVALTQSLHAITFGVYHAAALQLIRGRFTGRHQHRGVALYGSVSFGIGGALGSLYSGYLWSGAGPQITFLVAAGAAAIGAVLAGFIPRRD